MANLRDRVKVVTATTGTGTVTLGAAVAGYRTFASAYIASRVVSYVIEDGNAWETGTGTYSTANNTLTRSLDASSSGALLSLSGSATVSIAFLSRDNPGDWASLSVTGGGQSIPNGNTIIKPTNVAESTAIDFDAATGKATIQQSGSYLFASVLRLADNGPANVSYGADLQIAGSNDGFIWGLSNGQRESLSLLRYKPLTAGQQVWIEMYWGGAGTTMSAASFALSRVR